MIKKPKNTKAKKSKPKTNAPPPIPMSERQFKIALKTLGLTVASKRTSDVLGVGIRQVQRLVIGEQPVPRPVELVAEDVSPSTGSRMTKLA